MEEELAKGERIVEMPGLFPRNPAFERFQRRAIAGSSADKSSTDRQQEGTERMVEVGG